MASIDKRVIRAIDEGIAGIVKDVIPSVVYIKYENGISGSGVIISEDGLILTAGHVVDRPGSYTIKFSGGQEVVTKEVARARDADVGFLKVRDVNDHFHSRLLPLSPVKIGDSDTVCIGNRLLAIGSPWGKRHLNSATLGILSATSRDLTNDLVGADLKWKVLFQSDVAANPGNSGGPIFNLQGEMVGIVVGSYGPGSYAGITYCVPSNICAGFIDSAKLAFEAHRVEIQKEEEEVSVFPDIYYYGMFKRWGHSGLLPLR